LKFHNLAKIREGKNKNVPFNLPGPRRTASVTAVPRVVGLFFCLVFVSLIYFDYVTYLSATTSIFVKVKMMFPLKETGAMLHLYLPITTLFSVPKMAVMEWFDFVRTFPE